MTDAASSAIAETGAAGVRDMGKAIAALKEKYPGQMDFAKRQRHREGAARPAERIGPEAPASASIADRASARTRASPRPPISSARR